MELDATRRKRTVVLIDPEKGKLRKAYLHLPARLGGSANLLEKQLSHLKCGQMLKWKTPLEYRVHYYRRSIRRNEIRDYPVLFLGFIGIESMDVLVGYLMNRGAVLGGNLKLLREKMHQQVGDHIQYVKLESDHPLFCSYYDITEYSSAGPACPPVEPIPALELDGRVIVLSGVLYTPSFPCIANKLYVNAMAYLLIQPSQIGGRYLAKKLE